MVVRLRLQLSVGSDRVSELFTFFPEKKKADGVTIDQDGSTLIITGEQLVSSNHVLARYQLMLHVMLINRGIAWLKQEDAPLPARACAKLLTVLNTRLESLMKQRMDNYWKQHLEA